jgi:hypothetical protein
MSRAALLARARAAAEAGMVDSCTITRDVGTTTDRATGQVTPDTITLYSGRCRIQEMMAFSRDSSPTPSDPALMRYRILQLPVVASQGLRQGDKVRIDTCISDPDLTDKVMVVRDPAAKSEASARRVGVEEVTG